MPASLTESVHPLASLLAGYIAGAVDDDVMTRLDDLFEDASATAQERLAFARFYLDVLAADDLAEALPAPGEVPGLLGVVRA